ncbi:MAG: glycosyltransferase family 4 protein [Calditrichaeota bacterium]|nr:glycosyltransferase family 4 protein [Calditrichota bacterium]
MSENDKKPVVLHLTYELRRRKKEEVTSAVRNLIAQSEYFSTPYVVSLLRVPTFRERGIRKKEPNTLEVNSFGLPFGILLHYHLKCAHKLIQKAKNELNIAALPIEVIHAHKLTFEGVIGYEIAKKRNIPLILTIRQTDFGVLKHKKFYRPMYREIVEYSSAIIYLVPYVIKAFRKYWDEDFFENHIKNKLVFLPNIVDKEIHPPETDFEQGSLLTIVRMTKESVRRKKLKNLLQALKNIADKSFKLKIIGDGPYLKKVKQWVQTFELPGQVEFLGKVDNKLIDSYYRKAQAFVLPSKSESFGMVYAESLLNGTPILYAKNTGFDGLFEGVGVAVDPFDIQSIQSGLAKIIKENEYLRNQIRNLQREGAFEIFHPEKVREQYRKIINQIISGG